MTYTVAQMAKMNKDAGQFWFEKDTMRFFGTKITQDKAGKYNMFITSEKPPHGDRKYSVRMFKPKTAGVDTVGEFCAMSQVEAQEYRKNVVKALDTMGNREQAIFDNLRHIGQWDGSPETCLEFVGEVDGEERTFVINVATQTIIN